MSGYPSERTLELDATTVQVVEQLAQTWGVSRQEAVRRAVEQANASSGSANTRDRLAAFKALQRRLQLTSVGAAEWQTAVRDARR